MFDLHITCTKDITKIAIDFADGSCVCEERPEKPKRNPDRSERTDRPEKAKKDVDIPDWSIYNKKPKFDVVKPPEIPDVERQPKIDEVLNNLEI